MLIEVDGKWYVQVGITTPEDLSYWFQQAAAKNGSLGSGVAPIPKPKPSAKMTNKEITSE